MSSEQKPFYANQNRAFAEIAVNDDLLHPERNALVQADSLTETQYFGFSIPEEGIHSFNYLWHHPNLKVVTGGALVWRGTKLNAVSAELCDIRTYLNDASLANDLHDYRLESGYGVKVIEPLKRFHLTYSDPARKNSIDLSYEALAAPVMFGDGTHFEQPMRVVGELVLRGKRYDVDGFNVRDRSWGKPRPESILPMPPLSWMTGVFDESLSFNCTVWDQASGNPELTGSFALPEADTLVSGWIYRDHKVGRVIEARKSVVRAPTSFLPTRIDLQLTDDLGRTLALTGRLVASCPWQSWGNVISNISLIRWQCGDRVAHGDSQDIIWNDYYQFMTRR